jgi:hypothetical protein
MPNKDPRVYVASKVKHAPMWKHLRIHMGIVSSWIDEAGEGQTADYFELSQRFLAEIKASDAVVLYCEPGDILKGALLECGAALAFGLPVYCVGVCPSISRVFIQHPLWHTCGSLSDARDAIFGEAASHVE